MPQIPTAERISARKVKKSEFAGKGALIQLVGLVCCFIAFPFGLIPGLLLLIIGGRMAFVHKCSHCMNRVDKDSLLCPTCSARFDGLL